MSVGERVSLSAGEDGHAVNHEEAPAALVPGRRQELGSRVREKGGGCFPPQRLQLDSLQASPDRLEQAWGSAHRAVTERKDVAEHLRWKEGSRFVPSQGRMWPDGSQVWRLRSVAEGLRAWCRWSPRRERCTGSTPYLAVGLLLQLRFTLGAWPGATLLATFRTREVLRGTRRHVAI